MLYLIIEDLGAYSSWSFSTEINPREPNISDPYTVYQKHRLQCVNTTHTPETLVNTRYTCYIHVSTQQRIKLSIIFINS